jgi:signal peptidase I
LSLDKSRLGSAQRREGGIDFLILNMPEEIPEVQKIPFKKKLLVYLASAGLFLLELVKVAVLAGVTIALVRYFLFKPFYVKGASMEPNFFDKEYLIIDELSYRLRPAGRGEVIVFKYPENPKEYFLKRIIGLPGERVKVAEGQITVYNKEHPEGIVLNEPYLSKDLLTIGERITVLTGDQYFVLGDNRPNSYDSRRFGAVDKSLVVGRVFFRGWPFNRAQIIPEQKLNI